MKKFFDKWYVASDATPCFALFLHSNNSRFEDVKAVFTCFAKKKKNKKTTWDGRSLGNQALIFKRSLRCWKKEGEGRERNDDDFFFLFPCLTRVRSILFDIVCYSHEDQHGIFGGARQISVRRNQKSDTGFESSGNRHLETAHHRLRFLRDNLGDCFVRLPRQHLRRILKRENGAWRCDGSIVSVMKRMEEGGFFQVKLESNLISNIRNKIFGKKGIVTNIFFFWKLITVSISGSMLLQMSDYSIFPSNLNEIFSLVIVRYLSKHWMGGNLFSEKNSGV